HAVGAAVEDFDRQTVDRGEIEDLAHADVDPGRAARIDLRADKPFALAALDLLPHHTVQRLVAVAKNAGDIFAVGLGDRAHAQPHRYVVRLHTLLIPLADPH